MCFSEQTPLSEKRTHINNVADVVKLRRSTCLGHILRMNRNSLLHAVLKWTPIGKRRGDKPSGTWRGTVEKEMKLVGKTWNGFIWLVQDRGWEDICCRLTVQLKRKGVRESNETAMAQSFRCSISLLVFSSIPRLVRFFSTSFASTTFQIRRAMNYVKFRIFSTEQTFSVLHVSFDVGFQFADSATRICTITQNMCLS